MPSLTTHNTPALRVPGYTGVWEQKQINKLYRKSSQKNDLTYGPDQVISVANMYYKTDTTIHSEDYLKTYNIFELGDIAFEGNKSKDFQSLVFSLKIPLCFCLTRQPLPLIRKANI